jgi:hypothetical protein
VLDLFVSLLLMIALADAVDRFQAAWWSGLGQAAAPSIPLTLALATLHVAGGLVALAVGAHHLELARRHVA